jgi:hypothetical protein
VTHRNRRRLAAGSAEQAGHQTIIVHTDLLRKIDTLAFLGLRDARDQH